MAEPIQTEVSIAGGGDVFAPSVDVVTINFTPPPGRTISELYYEVRGQNNGIVYKCPLMTEELESLGSLEWDGEINGGTPTASTSPSTDSDAGGTPGATGAGASDTASSGEGPAATTPPKRYATPLNSPYSIQVFAEFATTSAADTTTADSVDGATEVTQTCSSPTSSNNEPPTPVRVEYHSVEVAVLPWEDLYLAASGQEHLFEPSGVGAEVILKWCQYRLHDQGCWAGPLDGTETETYKKGVLRYRLTDPLMNGWKDGEPFYERSDSASGAEMKLKLEWEPHHQSLSNYLTELRNKHEGSTIRRTLFSDVDAFNRGEASKLFIDNHRFFFSEFSEFSRDDVDEDETIKFEKEQGWLSRPTVPLKATVYLKGADGEKHLVPSSVEGTPLRWKWTDTLDAGKKSELEGSGLLPTLPTPTPEQPSYGAEYLAKTEAKLNAAGDYKNAVEDAGGILKAVPNDGSDEEAAAYNRVAAFCRCEAIDRDYRETDDGVVTLSAGSIPINNDGTTSDAGGGACVYLHPSTLGGDVYKATVTLDLSALEEEASGDATESAETASGTDAHAGAGTGGSQSGADISAETGWFVTWRRVFIGAYVGWPKCPDDELQTILSEVKDEYALGFMEIDHTECRSFSYEELFDCYGADKQSRWESHWTEMIDSMTTLDAPVKEFLRTKTPSNDSVWPEDPEAYTDPGKFADTFNLTMGLDTLNTKIRQIDPTSLPPRVPSQLSAAMTLADAYATSSEALVQSAAQHYTDALGQLIETDPDAPESWRFKETPALAEDDETKLKPVLPYTDDADTDLSPALMVALLVTTAARDEVERWAAGEEVEPTALITMSKIRTRYERDSLADKFSQLFQQDVRNVIKGGKFNNDTAQVLRRKPIELRQYAMIQRVGAMMFAGKMNVAEAFDKATRARLAMQEGRIDATDGMVLLDYRMNEPVNIDEKNPAYLVGGAAFGGLNGVAMIDRGQVSKMPSLFAHEMAHCMFFQHGKNAPGEQKAIFANHDFKDDNCIMSYPTNLLSSEYTPEASEQMIRLLGVQAVSPKKHYTHDSFAPHYCGKCLLNLRGWNIRFDDLVATSDEPSEEQEAQIDVRILPGTLKDDELTADTLTAVNVSFYPSDRVLPADVDEVSVGMGEFRFGALAPFPSGFGYSPAAAKDPAAFRIEVEDPGMALSENTAHVTVEVLKPPAAPGAEGEAFPPETRKQRALVNVECRRIDGTNLFRSRYLRLVTDEEDYNALYDTKQAILVTDIADGEGGDDDLLEILGQQVKVSYDCYPASKRA